MNTCATCKFWKRTKNLPYEWVCKSSSNMPTIGECRSPAVCRPDDQDVENRFIKPDIANGEGLEGWQGMPERLRVFLEPYTQPTEVKMFTVPHFGCIGHKPKKA